MCVGGGSGNEDLDIAEVESAAGPAPPPNRQEHGDLLGSLGHFPCTRAVPLQQLTVTMKQLEF